MRERGIEMACFLYNMMKYMESSVIIIKKTNQ